MAPASSTAARLYLNHDVQTGAAIALRREGYDVVAAVEIGMQRASDDEHMAHAAGAGRALVSFNVRDYPRIHGEWLATGKEHWGIIVSPHVPIRATIRGLRKILTTLRTDELRNQLRWL